MEETAAPVSDGRPDLIPRQVEVAGLAEIQRRRAVGGVLQVVQVLGRAYKERAGRTALPLPQDGDGGLYGDRGVNLAAVLRCAFYGYRGDLPGVKDPVLRDGGVGRAGLYRPGHAAVVGVLRQDLCGEPDRLADVDAVEDGDLYRLHRDGRRGLRLRSRLPVRGLRSH